MSLASINVTTRHIHGHSVRFLEAGQADAPTILLIHGGLGDAYLHWHRILRDLGTQFHLYAPDLPGFQDGSDALQKPSLASIMQWIADFLHDVQQEKIFLIGTSVGGLLARFYAAHYPATVERLILVDGGQVPFLPSLARFIINAPGISSAFYGSLYRQTYGRAALQQSIYQHELLTDEFYHTLERASKGYMPLIRTLLTEAWPAQRMPQCPTLVIWGKEDHLASPKEGEKLLHEIPCAELVYVEQSGHMPMLEQPSAFTASTMEFLKRQFA